MHIVIWTENNGETIEARYTSISQAIVQLEKLNKLGLEYKHIFEE